MKKGLRLNCTEIITMFTRLKHCPDEEGIKTRTARAATAEFSGLKHCPDEEGIKTRWRNGF